nr:hypothetical protein [Tanacetum cinerariifolium]
IETSDDTVMDDVSKQGRIIADMNANKDVTLKDVIVVAKDVQDAEIEEKPAELQDVVEVVTTPKLITEVVTAASTIITALAPQLTIAAAPTLTTAPSDARRRNVPDDEVLDAVTEPSIPSPTPPTPPPQPLQDNPSTSQVQLTPPQSPLAQQQSPQQQPQPSQDAGISMDLLYNLLDTCITLTRRIDLLALQEAEYELTMQVALSGMESLKRMLHVLNILSAGSLTTPQMVLNSPCLTHIKNWLVQIKRSLTSVAVKKVNDITRLQALVDKKRVIITEATIRDALCLDDAEGVECLPNEEIFAELARMGYEKPLTKLTFYKAFFSSRKFNFSKYIFDSLVRNVDSSTKVYMYPRFLQLLIRKQVGDLLSHTTKYSSPALTQKVFANMRWVDVLAAGVAAEGAASVPDDEVLDAKLERKNKAFKLKRLKKVGSAQRIETSDDTIMDDVSKQGRMIADMNANKDVTLKDVIAVAKDVQDAEIEESSLAPQLTIAAAPTLTTAPSDARRRKELEAKLNKNIDWDEVIDHVQRKQKKDNVVKRYQALKRKPQTEAQARKNMMIYLRNTKEQMDEEDSRALKRLGETQEEKAAKKQKLDEEVAELRRHL